MILLIKVSLHNISTCTCICIRKCNPSSLSYVATKQLEEVIFQLIKGSPGDVMYSKALNCIRTMRTEAIKVRPAPEETENGLYLHFSSFKLVLFFFSCRPQLQLVLTNI